MSLRRSNSKGWRAVMAMICAATMVLQTSVVASASVVGLESIGAPSPGQQPSPGGSTPVARITSYVGGVGVRNNSGWHQVVGPNVPLYSGDKVVTERGRCEITFNDGSLLRLDVGANITIEERPSTSGGILRTVTQYIGNLWFNIKKQTGTETHLETPTAVAAIRGTEGWQEVPDDSHSTHALTEGVEQITERVTQQSATIHGGQQVTAIKGVGFSAITSIAALVGEKYPMTQNARQLPKVPKNQQQTVPQNEQAPSLAGLNGINAAGLTVEGAGKHGISLPSLVGIVVAVIAATVVGVVIQQNSHGNPPHQTSVGGPTVGVGAPQKR